MRSKRVMIAVLAGLVLLVSGCGGSGSSTPPSNFTLTVTETGTGSGAVTSNPAGISCPTTCSASFASGTTVGLSAAAGANSTFAGWGGACAGTGTCAVTMNSNQAVSAAFNPSGTAVMVTVMPTTANVVTGASQQFMAMVTGTANMNVTWQVNGITSGNSTVGTITATGFYTAPPTPPASSSPPATVTITAVSQADPTKSSPPATVTINPNNQQPQTAPIELGTTGGNNQDSTVMGRNITCCSGTLGSLVSRGGTQFILSNNHVLARSDQAKPPEPIGQPGLADTMCQVGQTTVVANLTQFAPLRTSNVDAAIAAVVAGQVDPTGAILDLGPLSGTSLTAAPPANTVIAPAINMPVGKSGRSTGLTCSTITSIATTVKVDYSTTCGGSVAFTATFTNQEVINGGTFSAAGDSGSLVVDSQTAQPVGLLYAGSPTDTVANPIQDVLNALKDPVTMAVPTIVGGAQHMVTCPSGMVAAQQAVQAGVSLPEEKVAAVTTVKEKYANQLMADPAVIGVGVGASDEVSGEPAIIIFVDKNKQPSTPIAAQMDGVRTRIILTEPFRAFGWNEPAANTCRTAPVVRVKK